MTPSIHVLDQQSANQIAAGEVVERPVSVVKELVENALDAGAKRIDISIEGDGVPLIKVCDDGCGIDPEDLPVSVLRHATSKIRSIDDLNQLHTLGFRGEALPSIASVSQLEISSRPARLPAGTLLKLEGGAQAECREIGCPAGTTVAVRNLFYNTPARRKFLRSVNTEFGLISDMVGKLALSRPDVAFTLSHPRQIVLQTPGRGQLKDAIGAVLGPEIARKLIPVSFGNDHISVDGFISPPDLVRSSRQEIIFIINGRFVKSQFLNRILQAGYHTLIPAKMYPSAVLQLKLSPAKYDVNVHPTKMDVRFENEQELAGFFSAEIYQSLLKSRPLPHFDLLNKASRTDFQAFQGPQLRNGTANRMNSTGSGDTARVATTISMNARIAEQSSSFATEVPVTIPLAFVQHATDTTLSKNPLADSRKEAQDTIEWAANWITHKADSITATDNISQLTPQDTSTTERKEGLSEDLFTDSLADPVGPLGGTWPLAQVFNTYILATDGINLIMIDQHAAHERINYERLLKETKTRQFASQPLLVPVTLELTLPEEQALLEHLWALHEMGFVIENFGPRTYLLRAIPAHSSTVPWGELLHEFIHQSLLRNSAPTFDGLLEEWIYLLACKVSIRAKESLSILEMEQLIARLRQTENPYTCPHGRPTMIQFTRSELEKRFYRT